MKYVRKLLLPGLVFIGLLGGCAVVTLNHLAERQASISTPKSAQTEVRPPVYTRSKLLAETNKHRKTPLVADALLNSTAQDKCKRIVKSDVYEHGDLTEYNLRAAGDILSENLNYDASSVKEIVHGWMTSPSHREALTDETYTRVGFGICPFRGSTLIVQHLADSPAVVQGTQTPSYNVKNVDLNPYKYSVSPDAGGESVRPTTTVREWDSPKPYVSEPPKVTMPPNDDCHTVLNC